MDNQIKVLLKSECPHCSKEILIEVESPTPLIRGILMASDIAAAKEYVVGKLNELFANEEIEKKDLEDATEWIQNEETIFGPKDVDSIIDSIKNSK